MTDAVIVALITAASAVICQVLLSRKSSADLLANLEKQIALSDQHLEAKIDQYQAVTDTKIQELTREVRIHNDFAHRIPVLEERINSLSQQHQS